ncbi:MAG: prepilin peptidase [Clostridia bacterium]|nr:prepilin peptidase [Clostridia bacterium]
MVIAVLLIGLVTGILVHKLIEAFSEDQKISVWPVLFATAALTVFAYSEYGLGTAGIFHWLIWCVLFAVAVIDYLTLTVVDAMVYGLGALGLVYHLIIGSPLMDRGIGFLAGFGMYLVIYLAAKAYYKKEAFGFGDVMLMGAIGIFLGLSQTVLVGFMAFYLALIGILIQKIAGKKLHLKEEIAFGPSICLSAWIVSLYGTGIIDWYLKTFLF